MPRTWWCPAALVLLTGLASGVLGARLAPTAPTAPGDPRALIGDPGIPPGPPARPHPARGVTGVLGVTLPSLTTPDLEAQLRAARSCGATFVSLPLAWSEAQPTPGSYRWQAMDRAVNLALAQGLGVVGVLGRTPPWACRVVGCRPEERPAVPPRDMGHWKAYVTSTVRHFKDRISTWQLWPDRTMASFRGTARDFLALVQAGAAAARAEEPTCRLVVPESGALDVAWISQARGGPEWPLYDILGLRLPTPPPGDLVRPLATLAGLSPQGLGKEAWFVCWACTGPADPAALVRDLAQARAFGIARISAPLPADIAPEQARLLSAAASITAGSFVGARDMNGLQAYAFAGPGGPALIAWLADGSSVPLTLIPPGTALAAPDQPGLALEVPNGQLTVTSLQGQRALTLAGQAETLPIAAGPVVVSLPAGTSLAAFTRDGEPLPPSPVVNATLAAATEVSARVVEDRWVENGLYNERLRGRPGGGVSLAWTGAEYALHTSLSSDLAKDQAWYYFDVDDSFLYFDQGQSRLEITVEVLGGSGRERQGFNIYYDSTTGYRFGPWQWVAPGPGWHTYTVTLDDVNFANRSGYDFRISATGSRENMSIRSVTVRKAAAAP